MSVWVDFIKARMGEDEQVARAALAVAPTPWTREYNEDGNDRWLDIHAANEETVVETESGANGPSIPVAEHIAHNDPARVLRETEAKLRIMARHKPGNAELYGWAPNWCEGCGYEGEASDPRTEDIDDCPEIRDLASTWADRTDYPGREVTA